MDFVLASFPWIITWNLDMRRVEKIGLCVTMSLVSYSGLQLRHLGLLKHQTTNTNIHIGNGCCHYISDTDRLEG